MTNFRNVVNDPPPPYTPPTSGWYAAPPPAYTPPPEGYQVVTFIQIFFFSEPNMPPITQTTFLKM